MTAARRKEQAHARAVKNKAMKTKSIQIRAKDADRQLIDDAAELSGKNRTEFMMESALNEAHKVLLEQMVFRLKPSAWDKLMEILDAPAERNPKLQRLMQQRAPWEA